MQFSIISLKQTLHKIGKSSRNILKTSNIFLTHNLAHLEEPLEKKLLYVIAIELLYNKPNLIVQNIKCIF